MGYRISKMLSRVFDPVIRRINSVEPERLKRYLNLYLLAEIILFIGMAIYRHSFVKLFSDAFGATTVGGLYSFAVPVLLNLDDPLAGLMDAKITTQGFVMWSFSGFGYIALRKYNGLTEKLKYGRPMQLIHSIIFCLFLGVVGTPAAILATGIFILPVEPLWSAGPALLKVLAIVLGGIAIALFVTMMVSAIKALISVIKDFAKLYVFILILLIVALVVLFLLEKLVSFMEQSAFLAPLVAGIDTFFCSVGVSENSIVGLIQSPVFVKITIGVVIFLMYNITAVIHKDGLVI